MRKKWGLIQTASCGTTGVMQDGGAQPQSQSASITPKQIAMRVTGENYGALADLVATAGSCALAKVRKRLGFSGTLF